MINNYKAQRNVRAELSGAVDLGEPVSLYIAEDEVKYGAEVTRTGLKIKDIPVGTTWAKNATHYGWKAAGNGFDESSPGTIALDAEGGGSIKVFVPANTGTSTHMTIYQEGIVYKVGQQYEFRIMAKASEASRKIRLQTNNTSADCPLSEGGNSSDLDLTTDWAEYKLQWTATATGSPQDKIQIARDNDDSDGWTFYFKDVSVHEVTDHTYKLMAVNDTIPASNINAEAEGSELIQDDKNQIFDESGDWVGYNSPASAAIVSGKFQVTTSVEDPLASQGATLPVANLTAPVVGKTYRIRAMLDDVGTANADAVYKFDFGGTSETITASDGAPTGGVINTENQEYYADVTATNTTGNLRIRLTSASNDAATTFTIDGVSVKELYGYDYYNAPAYKFGIVSSVYDQSTGAMKTTGAAGDQLEVTVQGECILRKSGNYNTVAGYDISQITSGGDAIDRGDDLALPNQVGVIAETNANESATQPIILFQGVEFSESFVHKNSLQVMAKCDETITKFRPVSLFLDSEGDLLCRHDDIPAEPPDADTDHTGADPGKWGVAELGGVSGELIPVTVAGKTHINTSWSLVEGAVIRQIKEDGGVYESSNYANYAPNALGTTLKTGTGDVPISIFNGTPIGTITNWKRTIKVTAKANGAVNDFCPVSLYLDQYGEYRCIADDIPNSQTASTNGTWVDFRKWGVAQTTVADGEFVEIIVQGRTNVRNSLEGANRTEFVTKITSGGYVYSNSSTSRALSGLGIVEKEARIADGAHGTIIIF